ncbi:hypothetical protein BT96DRAFT_930682 [Gymnopus androsaceus JB14]|uniref:Uncharacterized protein n=1 Tax=Gymnopus androsaceus JB14 TaxID=1447944 RepID=A0A6A4IEF4_9AGAR|nr:hypothetical protein BT96DRAFT_930682 [Gymnopus androsaceus JB14]
MPRAGQPYPKHEAELTLAHDKTIYNNTYNNQLNNSDDNDCMDLLEVPKSMLYNFQISNPPYAPPANSPTSTQFFWQSHLPLEPSPPPCSPPQPPKPLPGTFKANILSGHFSLQWASKEDFVAWREEEQKKKSVEFWENKRIWDGYRYDKTLKHLHGDAYMEGESEDSDSDNNFANSKTPLARNIFIHAWDIHRIKKSIEAEYVQLNQDDGQLMWDWAEKLREKKSLLGFKARNNPPPPGLVMGKNHDSV